MNGTETKFNKIVTPGGKSQSKVHLKSKSVKGRNRVGETHLLPTSSCSTSLAIWLQKRPHPTSVQICPRSPL